MNLFGGQRTIAAEQIDRIQAWVRAVFHLNDETTVMVTEVACREPACPPIKTVIAVLKGPGDTRQDKIHKAADEIGRSDLKEVVGKEEPHYDQS